MEATARDANHPGGSGATITLITDTHSVLKSVPNDDAHKGARRRLRQQAKWLRAHDDPGLVVVKKLHGNGYEMEVLDDTPWSASELMPAAVEAVEVLERLWDRPAIAEPNWPRFIYYTRERGGMALVNWLSELAGVKSWERLSDTHGDPTLENLLRRDGKPVLVDPLPDAVIDGKLPSVRAIDLGKLLQSALDYERVRRGEVDRWSWNSDLADFIRSRTIDNDEWRLVRFFCALHVRRFIPYQTTELQEKWETWWPEIEELLHHS